MTRKALDRLTIVALSVVIALQMNVEAVATFLYGDWHYPVKQGDAADLVYYVQNLTLILILLTVAYRYFTGIEKSVSLFFIFLAIGKIIDQYYHPYTFEFAEVSWLLLVGTLIWRKIRKQRKEDYEKSRA